MEWLAVVLALAVGFFVGRNTQKSEPAYPTITEDDPPEEPKPWKHAMPPDRYLQHHPAGPYAAQARRIVEQQYPLRRNRHGV